METTQRLQEALGKYKENLVSFAKVESKYEGEKKLFEVKFSQLVQSAEGSSNAVKERNAKASEDYEALVRDLMNLHYQMNLAKAHAKGSEATYDTERSLLSYERALIEKNIISQ